MAFTVLASLASLAAAAPVANVSLLGGLYQRTESYKGQGPQPLISPVMLVGDVCFAAMFMSSHVITRCARAAAKQIECW
jgi:hypothetical protein